MVPPVLQQLLLLIESMLRVLEAEYNPRLHILGVPLFRRPNPVTRAIAELRSIIDAVAALAATPIPPAAPSPQAPTAVSAPAEPPRVPTHPDPSIHDRPLPGHQASHVARLREKLRSTQTLEHAQFVTIS